MLTYRFSVHSALQKFVLNKKSKMEGDVVLFYHVLQGVIYIIKIFLVLQNIIIKLDNQVPIGAIAVNSYRFFSHIQSKTVNSYSVRGKRRKSLNNLRPL